MCVYSLTSPTVVSVCEILGWHRTIPNFRMPSSALLAYLYAFVSPIFEEMVVRAFFMTEILALTRNSGLAILLSVLIQASYHLYQGIPNALSAAIMFFMLSIFYARTRRIVPVTRAHIIWEFSFTFCALTSDILVRGTHPRSVCTASRLSDHSSRNNWLVLAQ